MRELKEKFDAVTEDGTKHTIYVWHERRDTSSLEGRSYRYSLPELKLGDGRDVNPIDDETFEIVETRERLKRKR